MAEGTVDNLNIQLSADADQAVKSLNNLASTLRSINTAFTKDISGMRKFSKEIGTLTSSMKSLSKIKFSAPDMSGMTKMLKSLNSMNADGAKKTADGIEKVVNSFNKLGSVNFNDSGINKTVNALNRLFKVDMSKFNPNDFVRITDSISKLGNMPDVSSGVNRFVSSLSRLANAGEKTGQSANSVLKLGEQTRLAAQKLQSVGAINDDVNMFVQSIGRLATAGNKTAQTASGLSTLAKETIEFFKAMQNAPKVSQNTIAMTQALAQLASAGGKVGTATNSVTSAFEKLSRAGTSTMNALKKASSGIVSALQRITGAGKGVNGLTLSLGNLLKTAIGFNIGYGLLNFGKSMFTLGSDVTEVENVVDVAFGGMAQSAYDFAKTAQEQFGLSELMALRYSGILMSMFNASGIAQRDAAEMSTTLTGLAGDLASFYNIDQEDAFTKLRSALAGEVEPMRALGVDMTVASMEAYALSQGITESWQSMSQAEKVMLRYNYLMSVTSAQQNDFQRTQASFANQTRLLTINIQQLAATIGQGLIAAVLPAVTALNKLFAVLQKAAVAVRNFFYVLTGYEGGGSSGIVNDLASIGDASTGLEDLGSSGSDAADGLGDAAKAAEELKNATLGIDELNIISPNEPTSTGGTGGSGGGGGAGGVGGTDLGLDDGLLDLGGKDEEKYVSPWAEAIRKAFLAEDWEELGAVIADGLNRGLQKVYDVISWDNVGPKITAFTTAFTQTFNSLVDNFDWDLLGRTVGTGINTVVNTLNQFITGIDWKNLGKSFADGVMGLVNEVNWKNLGELIGNKFMIAWDILFGFVSNLDFGVIGIELANGLEGAISAINLETIGSSIGKTMSGIVTMFSEFAKNTDWWGIGSEIGNGIKSFFDNFDFGDLANAIDSFVGGLFTALAGAVLHINWADAFNSISDFIGNIDLGTAFLIAIPAISKFKNAINKLKKTNFYTWVKDLTVHFKNFASQVKTSGTFIGTLRGKISSISGQMTKLQKGVVGAVSVFAEFSLLKDAFYDISMGSENLVASLGKIAAGAGVAVAALKLIGLSTPWTAAITGATAFIAAIVGVEQASMQRQELDAFGESVKTITTRMDESTDAVYRRLDAAKEAVETTGVAEAQTAQTLADEYFKLAGQQNLTNDETERMKGLGDLLVQQFPQLEEKYNKETGLIQATKDEIQNLIDKRLEEARTEAIVSSLTEAYKAQGEVVKTLNENAGNYKTAQDEIAKAEEHFREVTEAEGQGSKQAQKAKNDLDKLKEKYGEITSSYEESMAALDNANSDIEYYVGLLNTELSQSGQDAGGNYTSGLALGLSDEASEIYNKAKGLGEDAVKGGRAGMDAHSPSKAAIQTGQDYITGLQIGLSQNQGSVYELARTMGVNIGKYLNTGLSGAALNTSAFVNAFRTAWETVKEIFNPSAPTFFKTTFDLSYQNIKTAFQFMASWFREQWVKTQDVFKNVESFFKTGFQKAYTAVTGIWDGLGAFFKTVAKNAFSPIEKLINGIISGVNWVLKEVDSDTRLSEWSGVAFKKGSDGVPRNMMGVVNDQKGATYRELIVPPNGKAFIPKGRNVMMPLQKGTKIMPADETKEFLKGFSKLPHFAKGIGSLFGWNEKYSGDMFDYLDKPDEITKIALDKFVDVSGLSDLWRNMAKGIVGTTFDSVSEFIGTIFEKIVPKVDYNPSAGVEQWRDLAKYALELTGQYTEANLDRLLMQMQSESGGNPNAINNWDINAQNGTPSKGLMQVIDPTFRAYAYPGYDKNIYDPLSNILAAIRYTLSRYGSLANGWKGHGYAKGIGQITMADLFGVIPKLSGGGVVMPGQLFVANERGPELLGRYGNRTTVVNNDQVVTSVSSGVEKAVERQNAEMTLLLRQILETNQRILEKDNSINLDGKRTNRLLDRAKSNAGYGFRRTVNAT